MPTHKHPDSPDDWLLHQTVTVNDSLSMAETMKLMNDFFITDSSELYEVLGQDLVNPKQHEFSSTDLSTLAETILKSKLFVTSSKPPVLWKEGDPRSKVKIKR